MTDTVIIALIASACIIYFLHKRYSKINPNNPYVLARYSQIHYFWSNDELTFLVAMPITKKQFTDALPRNNPEYFNRFINAFMSEIELKIKNKDFYKNNKELHNDPFFELAESSAVNNSQKAQRLVVSAENSSLFSWLNGPVLSTTFYCFK